MLDSASAVTRSADRRADDLAVRAERARFDVITDADLPGGLSPLVALTAVAQETEAIRVGPFVLNSGIWNPQK